MEWNLQWKLADSNIDVGLTYTTGMDFGKRTFYVTF